MNSKEFTPTNCLRRALRAPVSLARAIRRLGRGLCGIWNRDLGKVEDQGMGILRFYYDFLLDSELPGFSTRLKADPKAYEVAFQYWLGKTTDAAVQAVKDRHNEVNPGD